MANTKAPQSAPGSNRKAHVLWASVVAFGLLIFALPTVVVLVFGMLPTFVAFVVDQQKERYATFCVASMNVCGVFPSLLDLWLTDHSLGAAVTVLTDVFALVIILGAAAFGWVIYSAVPPVISSFLSVVAQRRIVTLRGEQRKLINEWGDGVSAKVEKRAPASIGMEKQKTGDTAKDSKVTQNPKAASAQGTLATQSTASMESVGEAAREPEPSEPSLVPPPEPGENGSETPTPSNDEGKPATANV